MLGVYKKLKEWYLVNKYKNNKITLGELKKKLNVSEWEIDDILRKYKVYRKYEL